MASKHQSPGPNGTTQVPTKSSKTSKSGNTSQTKAAPAKTNVDKPQPVKSTTRTASTPAVDDDTKRRKPRKLVRDPPSSTSIVGVSAPSASAPTPTTSRPATATPAAADELEALKARVRGLEAKVEDLIHSGTVSRSPRRRGKARKGSSSAAVPTLKSVDWDPELGKERVGKKSGVVDDEEEEADEELVRLEGELEDARQDLALFHPPPTPTSASKSANSRPKTRRKVSIREPGDEEVEEIPRADGPAGEKKDKIQRHVTLSGSYRIPLPAAVSIDDVKTIQSGVSAAQNVARRVLERRRSGGQTLGGQAFADGSGGGDGGRKSAEGTGVVAEKKGWGEWIGGYSLAITRAVQSIEHEAAMEGRADAGQRRIEGAQTEKGRKKRPKANSRISADQVEGLMG